MQQLYRISTMYWDEKYGTHSVSSEVISNMRVMMKEDSNNAVSNSFLLDDDSRNILNNILELKQEDRYYIRDMWKGYQLLGCSQIMGLMARSTPAGHTEFLKKK